MTLHRRGEEFVIRVDRNELMNSRLHASEDAMATLACAELRAPARARVLVGGLGMGFTLAATNAALPDSAEVHVAELMEAVVRWNEGPLGECAGRPLEDPRVRVIVDDVGEVLRRSTDTYDAVLLDVDNGPDGLTQPSNGWLYDAAGLERIRTSLRAGGILCVWSAAPDAAFTRRLRTAGFDPKTHVVRARPNGKGARHTIWVAPRK